MSPFFERSLNELIHFCPGARGFASSAWAAGKPGAREAIRKSLNQLGLDETDLRHPPRPERWSISIAHNHDLGGWLAVRRPLQIGWDIERESRIQARIIQRVCTSKEVASAPNRAFLWPAKEAFFKALEAEQPEMITELTVAQWLQLKPDVWWWSAAYGPRQAEGLLIANQGLLFAATWL